MSEVSEEVVDETLIRDFVRKIFESCSNEAHSGNPEDWTKKLLQRYCPDIVSGSKAYVAECVAKLRHEGPRQVCQYQFRKNDIVWYV